MSLIVFSFALMMDGLPSNLINSPVQSVFPFAGATSQKQTHCIKQGWGSGSFGWEKGFKSPYSCVSFLSAMGRLGPVLMILLAKIQGKTRGLEAAARRDKILHVPVLLAPSLPSHSATFPAQFCPSLPLLPLYLP